MAKSQRTARTTVNDAEFGSGEGEAAAVDAWEQQLALDEGEELQKPAPTRGKTQQVEVDEDDDQQHETDWNDDNWASDEDDPGEDDQDDDDEEQDEEDPDEEDTDDEDLDEDDDSPTDPLNIDPQAKVKVKIDGEETEVTYQELKDGYSRSQDYTRKTQALAEERKALEAKQQENDKQKQQWDQYLDQMGNAIKTLLGQRTPEQWAELERTDRYTYLEERQKEHALQERLSAVEAEKQRTQQEQQEKYQDEFKKVVQRETEALYKALPDWKDNPKVASRERSKMLQYAQTLGYTEQEVNSIVDHRAVLALRDAARLHALSANKDKSAKAGKVRSRSVGQLKAGSPQRKSAKLNKTRKASQNLAKSNTVDAAADYFGTLLDSED